MTPLQKIIHDTEEAMKKAVDATVREFNEIRTGRANPGLVEGIMVNYYGAQTPLKQTATISTPEPKLIVIHPWDPSILKEVERAILGSSLGLNPLNDGKVIRISIPQLTSERREELKKLTHRIAENGRVSVRTVRRDNIEAVKKLEDSKQIAEDERFKSQEEIQKITEKYIKRIDELLAQKEKELMEV